MARRGPEHWPSDDRGLVRRVSARAAVRELNAIAPRPRNNTRKAHKETRIEALWEPQHSSDPRPRRGPMNLPEGDRGNFSPSSRRGPGLNCTGRDVAARRVAVQRSNEGLSVPTRLSHHPA